MIFTAQSIERQDASRRFSWQIKGAQLIVPLLSCVPFLFLERRLSDLQSGHSGPAVLKFFFHRNVTIAEVERLSPCERHRKKTDI